jgi:hypothetical protein
LNLDEYQAKFDSRLIACLNPLKSLGVTTGKHSVNQRGIFGKKFGAANLAMRFSDRLCRISDGIVQVLHLIIEIVRGSRDL